MTKNRDMRGQGLEATAGNGLIDRRALLGRGMLIAGAIGTGLGGSSAAAGAEPLAEKPWSLEFGDRTSMAGFWCATFSTRLPEATRCPLPIPHRCRSRS
jgi:hypothetical protein